MQQRWRDQFMMSMAREGVHNSDICRRLLRYAATSQRLAEASFNGDWPADNGERKTKECPNCGSGWAPSSFKRGNDKQPICPDCRQDEITRAYVAAVLPGWKVETAGDPRGCVISLKTPDGTTMIGVPS